MNGIRSSNEVGWVLMQEGLSPFALDADVFQIVHGGENYSVLTDRLPHVFIEKRVPLDLFEYRGENWIVSFAMDRVNRQPTMVTVFRGDSFDTVTFRYCLRPESTESLAESLACCFTRIGQAVDAFGQACEAAIREDEKDAMSDIMKDLADPSPDSPWLCKKPRS